MSRMLKNILRTGVVSLALATGCANENSKPCLINREGEAREANGEDHAFYRASFRSMILQGDSFVSLEQIMQKYNCSEKEAETYRKLYADAYLRYVFEYPAESKVIIDVFPLGEFKIPPARSYKNFIQYKTKLEKSNARKIESK